MNGTTRAACLLALSGALGGMLCGCGSAPGTMSMGRAGTLPEPAAPPGSDAAAAFEHREEVAARTAADRERWADAACAWELLVLLRPERPDYRAQLTTARREIEAGVQRHLPLAAQAARRGELEVATREYLAVLALQPDNAVAADALRGLERERNRRSYLGQYARHTLARHGSGEDEAPSVHGQASGSHVQPGRANRRSASLEP